MASTRKQTKKVEVKAVAAPEVGPIDLFEFISDQDKDEDKTIQHGTELVLPGSTPKYSLSTLALAKSMFGTGNKTYRLRLTRSASITSSGAGALSLLSLVEPAGTAQYSAVSALFDSCRLIASRITYGPGGNWNPTATTGNENSAVLIAFHPSAVSGSTITITQIPQLLGSKQFALKQTNWPVRHRYKAARRPWSKVSATATGTEPTGGLCGAWAIGFTSVTAFSATQFHYLMELDYEFMNQAS